MIGPPLYERHGKLDTMAVYPLFPSQLSPDPPEILTLTEALQRGMELQDTGVISRVHVENPLPTAVLAGESELLMGQMQQRSIQFSCLLPAQKNPLSGKLCRRRATNRAAGCVYRSRCLSVVRAHL